MADLPPSLAGARGDAATGTAEILAAIAAQRARLLSPMLFVGMLVWAVVAEITTTAPFAITVVDFGTCLTAGAIAVISRRSSDRWGHVLCSLLWCVPVIDSVIGQWFVPDPMSAVMVPLEMVAVTLLLDTRWAARLLAGLLAAWIALSLRGNGHDAPVLILTGASAATFGLLMQILIRRALLTHITTAQQLRVELAERARVEEQLRHSQRMDALGTLAAGMAHDMNNVLGSITSFASLLDNEVHSPGGRADLEQIVAQSLRGAELTRGLLAFSRRGNYRKQIVQIDDVVRDVMPMLARTLPRSIAIRDQLGGGTHCIEGDPIQLGQVLINLSLNAAQAMDGQGTLAIASAVVALDRDAAPALGLPPGRYARFDVTDTGTGMDEATRRRVFEPFFTTKPPGQGTGLGLSTVWGIIQSHHGAVSVESALGRGSTFTCHLPLSTELAPPRAVASAAQTARLRHTGTVLIADDEPAVLAGTARIIERMGLSALRAGTGEEALQQYRLHAAAIDLVILDMAMPVMSGPECFDKLREDSQVPVLIATGYANDAELQDMVARGAELIEKPYVSSDLVAAVARLVKVGAAVRAAASAAGP